MDENISNIPENLPEKAEEIQLNIIDENSTDAAVQIEKEGSKPNKFKVFWANVKPSILPFLIFFFVQELSWSGNMFLGKDGVHPEIWLDSQIPVISEFIWVYYLTFPLAIFAFFWVGAKDRKHMWNLWLTAMISFAISGIVYFFWQTQMVKPELDPVTLSDKLLLWTWGTCKPINCLPSQHCMMALAIVIAFYNQKKTTPAWLRWFGYVTAVLIFLATVFLRQHYILDGVASLVIMVPIYLIVKYCKFGEWMLKKREQAKAKKLEKKENKKGL